MIVKRDVVLKLSRGLASIALHATHCLCIRKVCDDILVCQHRCHTGFKLGRAARQKTLDQVVVPPLAAVAPHAAIDLVHLLAGGRGQLRRREVIAPGSRLQLVGTVFHELVMTHRLGLSTDAQGHLLEPVDQNLLRTIHPLHEPERHLVDIHVHRTGKHLVVARSAHQHLVRCDHVALGLPRDVLGRAQRAQGRTRPEGPRRRKRR